jgi:hypothetical protein
MGKFKEKHGQTRVGAFLQNVAPDLLGQVGNLTGMKAFNVLGNLIDSTGSLSDNEKATAKELLQIEIAHEQERTKRHAADMASDSWLSKNIRPMTLIFLLFTAFVLIVLDSAMPGFNVNEAYITLYQQLLLTVFSFYFVLRGVEKMVLTRK